MSEQTRETPAGARIFDHTCGTDRDDGECMACSQIDCPDGEPLHYHHDGCPCCSQWPLCAATLTAPSGHIYRCELLSGHSGQHANKPEGAALFWDAVEADATLAARCEALEKQCEAIIAGTSAERDDWQRENAELHARCEALAAERDTLKECFDSEREDATQWLREHDKEMKRADAARDRCQQLEQALAEKDRRFNVAVENITRVALDNLHLRQRFTSPVQEVCQWDGPDVNGVSLTGCGHFVKFDLHFKFCPYCSGTPRLEGTVRKP